MEAQQQRERLHVARLTGVWRGAVGSRGLDVRQAALGYSHWKPPCPGPSGDGERAWQQWSLFGSAGYSLLPCPAGAQGACLPSSAPGDTAQQVCAELRGSLQRLGIY